MGNTFTATATSYLEDLRKRSVFTGNQVFAVGTPPAQEEEDEFEDPVERMLKKTGCLEKHYSVQECIAESKDWRKCQKQVQDFKECMGRYKSSLAAVGDNKL